MNNLSDWISILSNIGQQEAKANAISSSTIIIMFFVMIILICLSAVFSSSETALSAVDISEVKDQYKNSKGRKKQKAHNTLILLNDFNGTISAILIANNLVNIVNTSLVTFIFAAMFGPSGVIYGTIIMTISIVIFSEILPKIFAKKYATVFSLNLSSTIKFIYYLTYPINSMFKKLVKDDDYLTINSSKILLRQINYLKDEGALSRDKMMWLRNVIKLDNSTAKNIMIPIEDVSHIHNNTTNEEFLKLFVDTQISRFPVLSVDHKKVIGMVNIKDYFTASIKNKKVSWKDLVYEPIMFTKTTKLVDILDVLQEQRKYFAIVIKSKKDKIAVGIITIEDIMEEIVGEVYDENDSLEDDVHPIGYDSVVVFEKTITKVLFSKYLKDVKKHPKLTNNLTFGEWMKDYFKISEFQNGSHYSYENISIWVKDEINNNDKIFEIDIHEKENE